MSKTKSNVVMVPVDEFMNFVRQTIAAEFARHSLETTRTNTLTFDAACKYLGYSKSHLYKLTSAGIIPFSKPTGKKLYFDRGKLDEWLLSNSSLSNEEKETRASTYISTHK
jgi:excisionase family DNA binding protein